MSDIKWSEEVFSPLNLAEELHDFPVVAKVVSGYSDENWDMEYGCSEVGLGYGNQLMVDGIQRKGDATSYP